MPKRKPTPPIPRRFLGVFDCVDYDGDHRRVRLYISCEMLAKQLGPKAITNSSRRSVLAKRAILVEAVDPKDRNPKEGGSPC